MPLDVSFEETIHIFQGASVENSPPGRPDNSYHRLVGDPGTRNFEANNPGLFYTLLSRATTLGEEKKAETSAIFFKETNMIPQRIDKITCKQGKEGGIYKKIEEMRNWVAYLTKHSISRSKDEDIERCVGKCHQCTQDQAQAHERRADHQGDDQRSLAASPLGSRCLSFAWVSRTFSAASISSRSRAPF